MVKSTPAPKPSNPKYLVAPYFYALMLLGFVLFSLVGFGGFDFAGFNFEVLGGPFWVFSLALIEIFTLPFILRLDLSPLARLISAYLCLLTPLIFLAYKAFGLVDFFGLADYMFGLAMFGLGGVSFLLLGGKKVISTKISK